MGQAPTGSGSNAGYSVVVSSSDPADAEPVPQKSEAQAASDNREAVANASMVILAVPFPALEVTDELAEEPRVNVVIDVTPARPFRSTGDHRRQLGRRAVPGDAAPSRE